MNESSLIRNGILRSFLTGWPVEGNKMTIGSEENPKYSNWYGLGRDDLPARSPRKYVSALCMKLRPARVYIYIVIFFFWIANASNTIAFFRGQRTPSTRLSLYYCWLVVQTTIYGTDLARKTIILFPDGSRRLFISPDEQRNSHSDPSNFRLSSAAKPNALRWHRGSRGTVTPRFIVSKVCTCYCCYFHA